MNPSDSFVLDKRDVHALRQRIALLAEAYTPEWSFDTEHPDIGSTLALIFANQMADNIKRLNQLPEVYHTEFANLLGVSLRPASPAAGILIATLAADTIPGVSLPHGTKVLGQDADGDPVLFETLRDLYVTSARLTDALALSPRFGKIIPLLNGPLPAALPGTLRPEESSKAQDTVLPPFSLFDFEEAGIAQNRLFLYHKTVFDADAHITICLRPISPAALPPAPLLADSSRYRWSRVTAEGLSPIEQVVVQGDSLQLHQQAQSSPVRLDGVAYFALCVEALHPITEPFSLEDFQISAFSTDSPPEFILHNETELEPDSFLPFGDSASLFDECYLGHDRIFAQQGAEVTLSFHLSTCEKLLTLTPQQEDASLKIIKRKPKGSLYDTVTTAPQQVSTEYYNGLGWRKLSFETEWSTLFDGTQSGDFSLRFRCPDDWKPITMGGFRARAIRIRITQADHCYLQPCIHTMPQLSQLTLSYRYLEDWRQPQRMQAVCGTQYRELMPFLAEGRPFEIFSPLPYSCDALYLGFDAKPEGAPISLLFDAEESIQAEDAPLTFEYSTPHGFHPLKVIDGTESLRQSGTILFLPPSDFSAYAVEGVSRFWLRLTDSVAWSGKPSRFHPRIRRLLLNAADIRNQETLPEESFYIDSSIPHMHFPLAAHHLFAARVYVSEFPRFSPAAMEQMARESPEQIRITHDFLGNITSFFVRWEEVENFDNSTATDRHYVLDRMRNSIVFGDGVHVMIPPAQRGVAFTVQAICCNGQNGNLPAGAVNTLFGSTLYLGEVSNPIPTFGGSNLETVAHARQRGASLISGRGRLISAQDYVRAVFHFSDSIVKVRCIAGRDIWGKETPERITIAILQKDYADGAYSFSNLQAPLKERLLSCSEATVTEGTLSLCEPAYVTISVDVWVQTDHVAHSFDAQNLILDHIAAFLDPLGTEGWELGLLPTEAQLQQMLHTLRFRGSIQYLVATARYVDERGPHECGLAQLPYNPFAIAVSGTHRVHLELGTH